jgi:dihydroflavonol-4-reductase
LSVVIVNPSTPVGPGRHQAHADRSAGAGCGRGRMPAYVDTGLNLILVDEADREVGT